MKKYESVYNFVLAVLMTAVIWLFFSVWGWAMVLTFLAVYPWRIGKNMYSFFGGLNSQGSIYSVWCLYQDAASDAKSIISIGIKQKAYHNASSFLALLFVQHGGHNAYVFVGLPLLQKAGHDAYYRFGLSLSQIAGNNARFDFGLTYFQRAGRDCFAYLGFPIRQKARNNASFGLGFCYSQIAGNEASYIAGVSIKQKAPKVKIGFGIPGFIDSPEVKFGEIKKLLLDASERAFYPV